MEIINNLLGQLFLVVISSLCGVIFYFARYKKTLLYIGLLFGIVAMVFFLELLANRFIHIFGAVFFVVYSASVLSYPALLYLYVLNLFKFQKFYSFRNIIHLFPFLLYTLLLTPVFFESKIFDKSTAEEFLYNIFQEKVSYYNTVIFIFFEVIAKIQFIIYFIIITKLLRQNKKVVRLEYSDIDSFSLNWIRNLLICIIALGIVFWSFTFLFDMDGYTSGVFQKTVLLLFLSYMGIHALRQKEFSKYIQQVEFKKQISNETITNLAENENPIKKLSEPIPSNNIQSSRTTYMNKEEIENLIYNLNMLMKKEKIFTQQSITLNDIAQKLDTHKNNLSYILNEELDTSFYKYINSLRIEESCAILRSKNGRTYTIEGIAQMVGFKSKTNFNQSFKEMMGVTPSEYKKGVWI